MKGLLNNTTIFIKNHKVWSVIIAIVILGGGYIVYGRTIGNKTVTQYVLGTVDRGTLISSISGSGQVLALNQVDVKPSGSTQSSATFTEVDVKQGDTVKKGQLIAVVDNKSAAISLTQAKASLQSSQANYDKTVNGATATSLDVTKVSYDNTKQSLVTKLNTVYTDVSNTIRSDIDPLFLNASTYSPQFGISFLDSTTNSPITIVSTNSNDNIQMSIERGHVNDVLSTMRSELNNSTTTDVETLTNLTQAHLSDISNFLTDLGDVVNSISLSYTKYSSTLNSSKSAVGNAQSAINSDISSLSSALQSLHSSQAQLAQAEAPARPEDVATAAASLSNARASLMNAQQNYDQNFLRAPFDGIVAQVNAVTGGQANTATAAATIITQQKIAQTSLNEVDAAKIKLGDQVTLTFDAISDLSITGTVAQIDTIGTVTQGVVNYNAKIAFDTQDDRVKPGMTVSAAIITNSKVDVLMVPTSAIKSSGNASTVQVVDNPPASSTVTSDQVKPRTVVIEVGDSNDTSSEVTSGLTEGQTIVTRTISSSAAKTTTPTAGGILGGGRAGGGAAAARQIPR